MLKFIFLDVDGVLNTNNEIAKYGPRFIDDEKVKLIKKIVVSTGAKIILSSFWRTKGDLFSIVIQKLKQHELKIFSRTKELLFGDRSAEILLWLKDNLKEEQVCKYAIIDDMSIIATCKEVRPNLFLTSAEIGITEDISLSIIKYLC